MKIMKERICPLIHINCPPQINCQQCINIPHSPGLIELKSAVYQTLSKVSWINNQFKDMLVNDHNIIPHLIPPLIQFSSQYQLDKETDSQEQNNLQQSQEQSSSISLITSSLKLLENLIRNDNIYKEVIKTPKALHSLSTLSIYKIGTHFSQQNDQQTLQVRSSSRDCLLQIYCRGDASTQTELVNARYAGALVIAISTAGGHGEEQDGEIYWGLNFISIFLRCLNQVRNFNATQFPPQPLLVRRSVEQLEEEGGNEEIESQINNKENSGNIKSQANRAKATVLNYFIEQGNQRPTCNYQMKIFLLALFVVSIAHLIVDQINNDPNLTWQAYQYPPEIITLEKARAMCGTLFEEGNDVDPLDSNALPANFDARERYAGKLFPIHDQGKCGSYWAFAVAETAEHRLSIQGCDYGAMSPQDLVECDHHAQLASKANKWREKSEGFVIPD
ncbi:MAG: putative cathepsin B1 cysteine protease [Streblomastix strix]|uniref:Putative cathepsin B1 cysteine protease n=1 Tax=Streblomastix strix TaxID=222440 RepID=A0A5J4VNC4_9EUKA|nr:MAG: putative cathepsin B1 cysteine protease [Streblomastix strix]